MRMNFIIKKDCCPFDKVIEIGSGTGVHINYAQKIRWGVLPFPDNHFDRLIASHVLEHIYHPENALKKWNRIFI